MSDLNNDLKIFPKSWAEEDRELAILTAVLTNVRVILQGTDQEWKRNLSRQEAF